MYVPAEFKLEDPIAVREILDGYHFGLLVTAAGAAPFATHLPFLFDPAAGTLGTLYAHMARPNPQWRDFQTLEQDGGEALVIFQGPHAYVSPRDYASEAPNVPTWNYLAVHAYGRPRIMADGKETREHLARLIAHQESAQPEPWGLDELSEDFVTKMMEGIVAFVMPITRLEAKAKLNQNKSPKQRASAAAALANRDDHLAQAVATQMQKLT